MECRWLQQLSRIPAVTEVPPFSAAANAVLDKLCTPEGCTPEIALRVRVCVCVCVYACVYACALRRRGVKTGSVRGEGGSTGEIGRLWKERRGGLQIPAKEGGSHSRERGTSKMEMPTSRGTAGRGLKGSGQIAEGNEGKRRRRYKEADVYAQVK